MGHRIERQWTEEELPHRHRQLQHAGRHCYLETCPRAGLCRLYFWELDEQTGKRVTDEPESEIVCRKHIRNFTTNPDIYELQRSEDLTGTRDDRVYPPRNTVVHPAATPPADPAPPTDLRFSG